jgi:flagellar motor switch protein FliN/FliY
MTISTDLITATAAALAAALPVPTPLTAGEPVSASQFSEVPTFLLPDDPGAAVLARLGDAPGSTISGEVAVVVGADLVEALANSPLGALDLSSALQPALDAAAGALGAGTGAGQQLEVDVALDTLLARPDTHLVPLAAPDGEVVATVVVSLAALGVAEPGFAPAGEPDAADSDAHTVPTMVAPQVHAPSPNGLAPVQSSALPDRGGLDLLRDVSMEVTVELGRTRMTVRELLSLSPGAVVELDRAAGSPADLLVNGTLIARGEVVVVDEDFGIRITEILAAGADAAAETPKPVQGAA